MNISVTNGRKKNIRTHFLKTQLLYSHGDIEKKAGEKFDRVTVYRTSSNCLFVKRNYSQYSYGRRFNFIRIMQRQLQ